MEYAPLKIVMIAVETRANHDPYGWNGALYGRSSLERPWAFRAFMKQLDILMSSLRVEPEGNITLTCVSSKCTSR